MTEQPLDALVIGGGPAGSSAAYWLARAGRSVRIVEKKQFPHDETCGDGLTPRAVYQLREMGLGEPLSKYHQYGGLRTLGDNRSLEIPWPQHSKYPNIGYVVKRCDLDAMVANNAVEAGAELSLATEALEPIVEDGKVCGALVRSKADGASSEPFEIRASYVVVADGANSRFGRSLGTARRREMPQGMAIRTYFESPRHDDPWIESSLDVRDRNGDALPGYGWVFPLGDGTINVGIGLLSTFKGFKQVNTSHLMTEWASTLPDYWQIDPDKPLQPPTGGRLPMGGSVGPKVGAGWLAIGDAAGAVNPFNGEGIDYAYETGQMAAGLIDECVRTGHGAALQRYPELLDAEYGRYFKLARLFAKVIGQPKLMGPLTKVGMRSHTLMSWVLEIMANLTDEQKKGPPELIYSAASQLARVIPEPKQR